MLKAILSGLFLIFLTSNHHILAKSLPENEEKKWLLSYAHLENEEKIKNGIIQVMSYNTWGLPLDLLGHENESRFDKIGTKIGLENIDVIALQETFHPTLRDNLLASLGKDYFAFSSYRKNRQPFPFITMDCHGGLMTFSKFPIINEVFYPFPEDSDYSIIEKTGSKGFLISEILHGKNVFLVVNTHLYSGNNAQAEAIRMRQIQYLFATIEKNNGMKQFPIIFAGDFNIHHPDVTYSKVYQYITTMINDSKPNITESDYTMDHVRNAYVPKHEPRTKLDYIFYNQSDCHKLTVVDQSICMNQKSNMSDHFGWKTTFLVDYTVN